MARISDVEYQAVEIASEAVGGHLEALGITDIALMTREQWLDFILATYAAVCDGVREVQTIDPCDVPY